jgi:hypothetical protein
MANAMELLYGKTVNTQKQIETNLLYINVPYKLKDTIKLLGSKWDTNKKSWYITDDNNNKNEILTILNEKIVNIKEQVKVYIYLPYKYKDDAKLKYNGIKFDKTLKKWYIYENNILTNEIINIYHKGNFYIEDRPFNMSNKFDSTMMCDNLITLDEYLKQ